VSVKIGGKRKSCLSGIDTTWVNIGDFGEIVIFAIFAKFSSIANFYGPPHCFVLCPVGDCGKIIIFAIFSIFFYIKGLFALREILFVLQKNLSTRNHFKCERFFSSTKILSSVTKLQRDRRVALEAYNFLSSEKIYRSVTATLQRVIIFRSMIPHKMVLRT